MQGNLYFILYIRQKNILGREPPMHWGDLEIRTYNYRLHSKTIEIIVVITNHIIPYSNTSKSGDPSTCSSSERITSTSKVPSPPASLSCNLRETSTQPTIEIMNTLPYIKFHESKFMTFRIRIQLYPSPDHLNPFLLLWSNNT